MTFLGKKMPWPLTVNTSLGDAPIGDTPCRTPAESSASREETPEKIGKVGQGLLEKAYHKVTVYRRGAPPVRSAAALKELVLYGGGRNGDVKFEDFDLRATVGTGTFGRVRMVKIKGSLDRTPLALKIMKKSEIVRLRQVEHVQSEKDILSAMEHPFIVNLLHTFQDELRLYMVMEYVNGGELFSYLRKQSRLSADHAKFYSTEIILAFEYMHGFDIVYRDLKPENLLIDHAGHMKITDFGFAKVVADRTWTLCGTPEYLAPEIIQSKGHCKHVDWWALGILIYEMLAGYPPFYADNSFEIYQKVIIGKIDFPSQVDVRARDLIKKLLTQNPLKRFGCLKGGVDDIKRHKWYKGTDWLAVFQRQINAPYIPDIKFVDDTSLFDKYPDSVPGKEAEALPVNTSLFNNF